MDRVRRMIGCDSRSATYYTGRGVYIAVLDSGVARHPDLEGRIIGFRDFPEKQADQGRMKDIMMIMDTAHMCKVCRR